MIAHRLSTIVDADRILVMGQWRIVESGRHDDLLARRPCTPPMMARAIAELRELDRTRGEAARRMPALAMTGGAARLPMRARRKGRRADDGGDGAGRPGKARGRNYDLS